MLRAYQLSMVRAPHDSHGQSPWSLKDRPELNLSVRGQTVSTHILGLGIVLVGVLVLAIGLIMGLEFPKYVKEKSKEAQCVVYHKHTDFLSWERGSHWNRQVRIYYWELTNVDDFLYNGRTPRVSTHGTGASIAVLSPWYLQQSGRVGGEVELGWSLMPRYVRSALVQSSLAFETSSSSPTEFVFRPNITQLGDFNDAGLSSDANLTFISFSAWLNSNGSQFKDAMSQARNNSAFTASELKAVYRVLTSARLLGGRALQQEDTHAIHLCEEWAAHLCSDDPGSTPTGGKEPDLSECGVMYIFHKCHENISSQVREILQQTFCVSGSEECLNFSDASQPLQEAYFLTLSGFTQHVSTFVLTRQKSLMQTDLVVTRNQTELALGYDVTGSNMAASPARVEGFLTSHWMIDSQNDVTPLWTVYTCLKERDMDYNMKVKEYKGQSRVREELLRNPRARVPLLSHTDFAPACADLRTCVTCSVPGHNIRVFEEELFRPVDFRLNASTSYKDVKVYRYNMAEGSTSVPVTLWPHNAPKLGQTITVEAVTGKVWQRNLKLQWNVGIPESSAHAHGRNIATSGLPLPVFWVERSSLIKDRQVSDHKHLVTRLMEVSCGGVIGFSVAAFIVVLIGLVICVYPSKPNRVTPVLEEVSSNGASGRHV
ncbi:uncharacterized protein LOC101864114 [Aplysia californica]|uniref:Uncharacterized protein LOC101864114 n=1 Tax=Aplysia californica TaxID=6500 RepID=A0ABM1W3P3_APLCA|nr:uncharacterized protein LOC101864114 [Aplysia californica]